MAIIEEASKDEVVGLRRYFEVRKMNGNDGTIEEMIPWVRHARVFKRRATNIINQGIGNMINASVN